MEYDVVLVDASETPIERPKKKFEIKIAITIDFLQYLLGLEKLIKEKSYDGWNSWTRGPIYTPGYSRGSCKSIDTLARQQRNLC
jgi:hypothetical protein